MDPATSHLWGSRRSPLDDIMPPLVTGLILCFPCDAANRTRLLEVLNKAVEDLVRESPSLAGRVTRNESENQSADGLRPGQLLLQIPEPLHAPKVIVNDLTESHEYNYRELIDAGVPMSKLDSKIFAPQIGVATTANVVDFRANFITGGCLLTICKASEHLPSRILADDIPASLRPLVPASEYADRKPRPELWRVLGLDWRPKEEAPAEPPFILASETSIKMFKMSASALASVKRLATSVDAGAGWVSTNDALVAFLWTAVMRARFPEGAIHGRKTSSYVSVAINGRKGLEVPAEWPGNVVFCCMTELPLDVLTAPVDDDGANNLPLVAQSIRRRVAEDREPGLLRDAVALAACIPDVRQLGNAFRSWLDEDLVTTSLVDLPFHELDFGSAFSGGAADGVGSAEAFRMPAGHFAGICCMQPRLPDGSVEFVVSMKPNEMARLESDRLFQLHSTFVSE
ncbi:hypothetical protein BDP81DRAFT_315814 [Colletotrichum phormii]|uniref:Trichothecene 3-O-acetyltransferase-like N-terminal domain-containing protein n=1 Tax=Colletotrichum phormii TaxID=359342 RepID=A0AAI9ZTT3_9PEZI|nr:uncharacterized protein BDP81DRAFT_315814 [Colletotrichum phormii]KAK1638008.1 hypothetical protein BDP81DRAFT_315814 [Colletotrichum phormii]